MFKVEFEVKNCESCPMERSVDQACGSDYYECSLTGEFLGNYRHDEIRIWKNGKPPECPAKEVV